MTVPHPAATGSVVLREVDGGRPLSVDDAYARAAQAALADSAVGAVGLEIETHLVDLDSVDAPVAWSRLDPIPGEVRAAAGCSAVSLEPGAQCELSGPPAPEIAAAVAELCAGEEGVRQALAKLRLGLAPVGADPLRPSRRVNPRPRYQAMEQHFAATGRGAAGAVMMNSTAAMQLNLQAGPEPGWPERVARAHQLGPTLVAISACSPWLHGRDTGWKSARQRAWSGLDSRACGPVPGAYATAGTSASGLDPASAWARYALSAPVSFVRASEGQAVAVRSCVSFEQWARGTVDLAGRAPTAADLDTHLTTLFPPVRLRGYLELRYLDMTGPRWWPAIAAVATTLMDDPVAADLATDATARSGGRWTEAARDGLGDPVLADSARRCLQIAVERAPGQLGGAVCELAELVDSGRCPGDLLAGRIAEVGPRAALEELAHV